MRLLIDTKGIQFRVAGLPKPRPDFRDKDKQATTPDTDGNRPNCSGCAAALVVALGGPMGWLPNRLPVVAAWL